MFSKTTNKEIKIVSICTAKLTEKKEPDRTDNTNSVYKYDYKTESSELEKSLTPIFEKYGLIYNIDTVFKIIGKTATEELINLCQEPKHINFLKICLENALEKYYDQESGNFDTEKARIEGKNLYNFLQSGGKYEDFGKINSLSDVQSIIKAEYDKDNNPSKVDFSKLSEDEKASYIKNYFRNNLQAYTKEYKSTTEAKAKLLIDFNSLVSNMSDKDKYLLKDVVSDIFNNKEAVDTILNSFENDETTKSFTNSFKYSKLKDMDKDASTAIMTNMSNETFNQCIKDFDADFSKFYNEHKDAVDNIVNKINNEVELSEKELELKTQLDKYKGFAVLLEVSAANNRFTNQEQQKNNAKAIDDIMRKTPVYESYVYDLAEYITEHADSFSVPKEKLTKFFDEITNNKFSEELSKVNEKSATDETGKFKTASEEVIDKSKEKIQAIKQSIEDASNPKPIVVEAKNNKGESADTSEASVINYETITSDDGADIIKDIFTGKVKVSEYLEQVAIKKYKLMNTAMQGNILLNATGEFFNDLVHNLETSTFEHLLSIGWKGRSYAATKQVKDEVEQRENGVA